MKIEGVSDFDWVWLSNLVVWMERELLSWFQFLFVDFVVCIVVIFLLVIIKEEENIGI